MGTLSTILLMLHVASPIFAAVLLIRRGRRRRQRLNMATGALLIGVAALLGGGACATYAVSLRGRVPPTQVALASYAALSVICVLWGFNVLLRAGVDKLCRVGRHRRGMRSALAQTVRAAALYAVALPYLMAVTLVYRPKVIHPENPVSILQVGYEPVTFDATDGQRVAGWWIPASSEGSGTRTVILCHGFLSDKSRDLMLARDLVPAGFNILAIDLRAHGESAGQLAGFGPAESHDVLGAVRWLRSNKRSEAKRIFGLGHNLGAAALLAAAADPGAEGQSIDALALFSAYDDPASVVGPVSSRYLLTPLDTVVRRAAMPVAGAFNGGGLDNGSPLRDVRHIWPRPVLFIHGQLDKVVPFDSGRNLYDNALQPKYHYWLPKADDAGAMQDPVVSQAVRLFFENAQSIL